MHLCIISFLLEFVLTCFLFQFCNHTIYHQTVAAVVSSTASVAAPVADPHADVPPECIVVLRCGKGETEEAKMALLNERKTTRESLKAFATKYCIDGTSRFNVNTGKEHLVLLALPVLNSMRTNLDGSPNTQGTALINWAVSKFDAPPPVTVNVSQHPTLTSPRAFGSSIASPPGQRSILSPTSLSELATENQITNVHAGKVISTENLKVSLTVFLISFSVLFLTLLTSHFPSSSICFLFITRLRTTFSSFSGCTCH